MEESILKARDFAYKAHRDVNHRYGRWDYSVHLSMCDEVALMFEYLIPLPLYEEVRQSVFLHDTIEDCRLTFNDIKDEFGDEVAEIVYACTNEKGKTRAERANDKYYEGIKKTPGAPFVKLCDRIANITFSKQSKSGMFKKYRSENEEFISKIESKELSDMTKYLRELFNEKNN